MSIKKLNIPPIRLQWNISKLEEKLLHFGLLTLLHQAKKNRVDLVILENNAYGGFYWRHISTKA